MADPELIFRPSNVNKFAGNLRVVGVTTNYVLHFGDGFAKAGKPNENHDYVWPSSGPYTAVLVRDGERTPFIKKVFRILEQPSPNVTVEAAADADYTGRVTINDPAEGPVGRFEIIWARGETPQEVIGIPGTVVDHYFGAAGSYLIRVVDLWSSYKVTYTIDITEPVIDPDATIAEDTTDPERYTVKVEVTNSSGSPDRMLTIQWGDGSFEEVSAAVGTTVSHRYDFDDDYLVWVSYSDDEDGKAKFLDVTVPFTDGEQP
jgi:hypothetical protein